MAVSAVPVHLWEKQSPAEGSQAPAETEHGQPGFGEVLQERDP